jgi:phosphatidylserine synthase
MVLTGVVAFGCRHILKIPEASVSWIEEEMSDLETAAWVIMVVLLVVSLIVVIVLSTRKQNVRTQNYRRLMFFGVLWFFVGVALMVAYVLMDVPFWIGLPVAMLGLVYQLVGLWRQWKPQEK